MNTRTHLDFQLQLGYVAESVKVTGVMRLLETDLADIGAKIEQLGRPPCPSGHADRATFSLD